MRLQHAKSAWAALIRAGSGQIGGVRWAVERSENGRRRPARWSIRGDRLCLLQPEISKDEPVCYRVVRIGDELQYRDDRFVAYRGLIRPMPQKD